MAAAARVRHQRGFALLLVLWAMVLLSLIGARIAASGRAEAQLAANVRDAAVTEAAADGAVQEAAFHLLDPSPARWAAGDAARGLAMPGAAVTVRIESEDGKVNPNLASAALLEALLRETGADARAARQVADAILAWRFPWSRAAGASDPQIAAYRAAGLGYAPPGAPFRSLDEVGAVLGMTPALLARVRPYLSLYADAEPDAASASRPVLAALSALNGGATPPRNAGPADEPRVVSVTAAALGPNGTRFARHAILRVSAQPSSSGQTAPDPVEVLGWDVPGSPAGA